MVAEAHALAEKGVREINLIAQDITAYGADREDGAAIEPLLRELVKIEKIDWIRLLYATAMDLDCLSWPASSGRAGLHGGS